MEPTSIASEIYRVKVDGKRGTKWEDEVKEDFLKKGLKCDKIRHFLGEQKRALQTSSATFAVYYKRNGYASILNEWLF